MAKSGLSRGRRLPPSRRRAIRQARAARAGRVPTGEQTLEAAQASVSGGQASRQIYFKRRNDLAEEE